MGRADNMKEMGRKELEKMFKKNGYEDYRWINPKSIVVSQWARMKCMFGCRKLWQMRHLPAQYPLCVRS